MDPLTLLLILGGAGLVLVVVVLVVLNRSWGDSLPSRIEVPSTYENLSALGSTSRPANLPDMSDEPPIDEDELAALAESTPTPDPDAVPTEGLILIEHPMLLQAIERSQKEGGAMQEYVVRDGNDLYLSLDLIRDPVQRHQAAEMIHRFQTGKQVGVWEILSMAQTFGRMR
jgi:hypothetical protein